MLSVQVKAKQTKIADIIEVCEEANNALIDGWNFYSNITEAKAVSKWQMTQQKMFISDCFHKGKQSKKIFKCHTPVSLTLSFE